MLDATAPFVPEPTAHAGVVSAQVLVSCPRLEPTLAFFQQQLGFRLDAIYPADRPRTAMISGHGLHLRLVVDAPGGASDIYLLCDPAPGHDALPLIAPNGLRVHRVAADPPMRIPATQQQWVLTRGAAAEGWCTGRAGMHYRDLIPGRLGDAFIASHIRIVDGGRVPDQVHFHKIRFQAIFCRAGWIRVAYEGQGEPLVMHAGDCVLQPPLIRHQVLESSAGAEVIEIGAPAEHVTMADWSMALPDAPVQPARAFHGQHFVFHQATSGTWSPWRVDGYEVQDTGIGRATGGMAGVRVVRAAGQTASHGQAHASELCFYFVLSGSVALEIDGQCHMLGRDDCITIPDGRRYTLETPSPDLALLEASLPADIRLA